MRQRIDSLAQQVEHNTFNVGVLGSSPKRITKESESYTKVTLFFYALNAPVYMVRLNRLSGNFWLVSFKISYLCLPLFYEPRTTPSCHPSGCAYRQL